MTWAIGKWLVAIGLLVGSYFAGSYVRGRDDADDQMVKDNVAAIADQVRVRTLDGITLSGDLHFTTEITYYRATMARNADDQHHAIEASPELHACPMPADLVRLRREQVEASARIAAGSAQ
jgi:hypothetical protein